MGTNITIVEPFKTTAVLIPLTELLTNYPFICDSIWGYTTKPYIAMRLPCQTGSKIIYESGFLFHLYKCRFILISGFLIIVLDVLKTKPKLTITKKDIII